MPGQGLAKLFSAALINSGKKREKIEMNKPTEDFQINGLQSNNDPKITVICCVQDQEQYAAQVIDMILAQKTNVPFELVIAVGVSEDGTKKIAENYSSHDNVKLYFGGKNESMAKIFIKCAASSGSRYIAYCSGDNAWTDEYKLQKQYDFLENEPDLAFCIAGNELIFDGDRVIPNNYSPDNSGRYVLPFCDKSFGGNKYLSCVDVIRNHKYEPSAIMFRWDHDIVFPEWYYDCRPADVACQLIQLNGRKSGVLKECVCHSLAEPKSADQNNDPVSEFLGERLNNLRWLAGILDHYTINAVAGCPRGLLLSKLKSECSVYLNTALNKNNDVQSALDLFRKVPLAGKEILKYYISADADRRNLERVWGESGYTAAVRQKPLKLIKPFAKVSGKLLKIRQSIFAKECKHALDWLCYWRYSLTPKRKNLWVVSGFPKRKYMDNAKYFFEYVSDHAPEIEIWWLTRSPEVYQEIKEAGRNVCMFGTKECRKILSHARVGVVDHYACSDFERMSGFNNGIGIVNLWHGVGFKAAGDENGPKWTNQPGLVRSTDILPQDGDSAFRRFIKKFKYFRHAYMRELFEKYLMFVCPGQERVEMVGKIWGIPESCYFMAGHPRNEPMYRTERDAEHPLVMYAPTYREFQKNEIQMIDSVIAAVPKLQQLMEKVDGTFAIRLHPHTWRNYKGRILEAIRGCNRVVMDNEKDVYPYLGKYSVIISDYSSIALDLAMLDRPTIFLCPDLDDTERGFNLDFRNVVPGPIVMNWDEAIEKIDAYISDPELDSDLRKEKCRYFFTPEVNDIDNSARIIAELKKRIGMR